MPAPPAAPAINQLTQRIYRTRLLEEPPPLPPAQSTTISSMGGTYEAHLNVRHAYALAYSNRQHFTDISVLKIICTPTHTNTHTHEGAQSSKHAHNIKYYDQRAWRTDFFSTSSSSSTLRRLRCPPGFCAPPYGAILFCWCACVCVRTCVRGRTRKRSQQSGQGAQGIELVKVIVMLANNHYMIAHNLLARIKGSAFLRRTFPVCVCVCAYVCVC